MNAVFFSSKALMAIGVALAMLSMGCADSGLSDLRQYVGEVNQRKARPPDPLPPIKPYEVFLYSPSERKPFQPFFQERPAEAETQEEDTGIKPDLNRNREELEGFPLDSLRMVGTLERDEDIWAVIVTKDATIHRVQIGNYMGQHHGQIINIQEDRLELVEIARDAQGRWQERAAGIALNEGE